MQFTPGLFVAAYTVVQNREIANEALQEGFIRVMNHMDTFEPGHAFFPWARVVVVRVAQSIVRTRKHTHQTYIEDIAQRRVGGFNPPTPDESRFGESPEKAAMKSEIRELTLEALPDIEPRHREVLEMFYFQHMSGADIAAHMGVTENTIKQYLYHARKALEAQLEHMRANRKAAYEATQRPQVIADNSAERAEAQHTAERDRAIESISDERNKTILRLRLQEKLPYLEIARRQGVSEATILRWMPEAEQQLHNIMEFLRLPETEQRARIAAAEEQQRILVQAIEMIADERLREIMRMDRIEGLSQREIADRISRSQRTVQVQLTRGAAELERNLQALGGY